MAVYVDRLMNHGWHLGPNCHMFADTLEELHAMADKIGMKRSWFQNKPELPHYDLVASRRKKAIQFGAIDDHSCEIMILARRKGVNRIAAAKGVALPYPELGT